MKHETLHPIEAFGVVPAIAGDIRVEKLEDRVVPRVAFPHKHNFFQVVFVVQASGWHEIDFVRHPVSGAELFIMKPAQVHNWSFQKGVRGWVIEFTDESFGSMVMSLDRVRALPDVIAFAKSDKSSLRQVASLCEQMYLEFTERRENYESILQTMATLLFAFAERAAGTTGISPSESSALTTFRELVERNFRQQHEVQFYSERLRVSARALSMRSLRWTGQSAREIIFDRIMLEAKRKLAYSDEPIFQIGHQLGFEDPNHFSRFFKQRIGSSPAEFRRKQQRR